MATSSLEPAAPWPEQACSLSRQRHGSQVTAESPAKKNGMGLFAGFTWSVLLHATVVLLFLAAGWLQFKPQPQRERISLELFGMLTNRQEQQQIAGMPSTQAPQQAAPEANPATPQEQIEAEPERVMQSAPSPVKLDKPKPVSKPRPKQVKEAQQVVAQQAGAEQNQVQQTIRRQLTEMELLQIYVASLAKAIRERLVYPRELRAQGYIGTTSVGFTVTEAGGLLAGSLRVIRSSGYAELDASAIRSVQSSAPFPKPDRQRVVVVPVTFSGN